MSAPHYTTADGKGSLSVLAAAQLQEVGPDTKLGLPEVLKVTPWKPTANVPPYTFPCHPGPSSPFHSLLSNLSGKGPSSETPGPSRTKLLC